MYWVFSSVELVTVFGAWVVPFVLLARADHPRRRPIRLDRQAHALLAGGTDTMVDAVVADLVARGVLRAEHGVFAVAPHAVVRDPVEVAVIDAVLEVGRGGLAAVRTYLHPALPALTARHRSLLTRKGYLVTDGRRVRKITAHCIVAVVIGVGSALGASLTTWVPADPVSVTLHLVLVVAWVVPPAVVGVRERAGFRGAERRSALGRAASATPLPEPGTGPRGRGRTTGRGP